MDKGREAGGTEARQATRLPCAGPGHTLEPGMCGPNDPSRGQRGGPGDSQKGLLWTAPLCAESRPTLHRRELRSREVNLPPLLTEEEGRAGHVPGPCPQHRAQPPGKLHKAGRATKRQKQDLKV